MINGIEDKCVDRSFIFSIFNGKPDGGNLVKGFWVTLLWGNLSIKNLAMAVADEVDSLVERSPLAPILLFNEADGILGIRQEGAQRSVDKMENSIQNIILQEMEKLGGILIATTNLTQNLDPAFERRILRPERRPDRKHRAQIRHQRHPLRRQKAPGGHSSRILSHRAPLPSCRAADRVLGLTLHCLFDAVPDFLCGYVAAGRHFKEILVFVE